MRFEKTTLPGVIIIEPDIFRDERGFFLETFHQKKYQQGGIDAVFVQDNHSKSQRGILRGLHAQLEHPQGKLIRVLQGEIFDVAVDIRTGSATFGKWFGTRLSADNFKQLYVPPGFAHGFCVLSPVAEVEYKCTELYSPADEITIAWNDKTIGIDWPLKDPILSQKDQQGKTLEELPFIARSKATKQSHK